MISALFNQPNYAAAKKLLDATVLRHEAIASNLANIETPNYKRVDVAPTFQEELRQALALKSTSQIDSLRPQLALDPTATATYSHSSRMPREVCHERTRSGATKAAARHTSAPWPKACAEDRAAIRIASMLHSYRVTRSRDQAWRDCVFSVKDCSKSGRAVAHAAAVSSVPSATKRRPRMGTSGDLGTRRCTSWAQSSFSAHHMHRRHGDGKSDNMAAPALSGRAPCESGGAFIETTSQRR